MSKTSSLEKMKKELNEFPAAHFVAQSVGEIRSQMDRGGFKGTVFGANGGIDSLVTAALCAKAIRNQSALRLVGLQMNDSRIRGETYNPYVYRTLGVELKQVDITKEAVGMEKESGLPPRWFTMFLLKLILRRLPARLRRRVILNVESGEMPAWALRHFQLLALPHRLRIRRLAEYADQHQLMLVICANLTEISLGYFVEGGVDDTSMGDYAPLAGLYKSQVFRVAFFLGFPDYLIRQPPSPGFGGIGDEELLGPYGLVDLALAGFRLGCSDENISHQLSMSTAEGWKKRYFEKRSFRNVGHVRFLRQLMELSTQKAQFPKHPQQLNGSASPPFGVLAAGLESTWDWTTLDKGKTGMSSETKRQLEECFELEAAIKAEYLEGQLNREKLHGDLDSRYRRIERLCRQLEALPLEVREFARFKNAVTVPDEDVRLFFQRVLGAPEYFTDLTGLLFRQMLKKIDDCATDWGIDPSNIDRLLARARFTGILDSGFRLKEHFRNVISAYLALSIERVERKPSFLLSSIAPLLKGVRVMKYEEVRAAVMDLDDQDRKRLIAEVAPTILAAGHMDDASIALMKKFVDVATVRD